MSGLQISCWIASIIVTFICTHALTRRAAQREINDLRALVHKLYIAFFGRKA
jgi:hypothetical protein